MPPLTCFTHMMQSSALLLTTIRHGALVTDTRNFEPVIITHEMFYKMLIQ